MNRAELSDAELLDYVQGRAGPALSARIKGDVDQDPGLASDVALMRALRPAIAGQDVGPAAGEFGWHRLRTAIQKDNKAIRPRAPMRTGRRWRFAAIAMGLAVLGLWVHTVGTQARFEPALYGTASGSETGRLVGVIFAPEASTTDIEALLRGVGARLVDGPSAIGMFRVAFGSDPELESGRSMLRDSALVELVAEVQSP